MISDDDLDDAARWIRARLEAMLSEISEMDLSYMEVTKREKDRLRVRVSRRDRSGSAAVRTPSLERYGL